MPAKKRVWASVPDELYAALDEVAVNTGISLSQLVRKVLFDWAVRQGYALEKKLLATRGRKSHKMLPNVAAQNLPKLQALPRPKAEGERPEGIIVTRARTG